MRHRLAEGAVVAVGAVVTVPAGGVMATLDADSAATSTGQKVQLLVEATATGVQVATTCCNHQQQPTTNPRRKATKRTESPDKMPQMRHGGNRRRQGLKSATAHLKERPRAKPQQEPEGRTTKCEATFAF